MFIFFLFIHTHDSNKEVPEDKGPNPNPEQDIGTGEEFARDLDEVIVYLVPLIEGEQLEESNQSIWKRAGKKRREN